MEPVSGTTYVHGQTVTFRGSAYDVDDNVLRDDRLAWTSSLMGPLGTGGLLQRTDLIVGTHVITLTATDSDANAVSAKHRDHGRGAGRRGGRGVPAGDCRQ